MAFIRYGSKVRFVLFCIFVCLCVTLLLGVKVFKQENIDSLLKHWTKDDKIFDNHPRNLVPLPFNTRKVDLNKQIIQVNKTLSEFKNHIANHIGDSKLGVNMEVGTKDMVYSLPIDDTVPCYNMHVFYYPWYGTPQHDGKYFHWNHPYLPHWNKREAEKWPKGQHTPPLDVGANFYPALGAYSSSDPAVIDAHMQMMRYAGIGVVAVSWYPPGDADNEGKQPDSLVPILLDAAHKYKLKVAIHVEPYKDRNQHNMKENVRYLIRRYGTHPAFYRTDFRDKKNLPLLYIYDSYLVSSDKWAEIFDVNGRSSLRNTELDAIFIGLVVEDKHKSALLKSGFDGFYTYFATNGFTYGSSLKNWGALSTFAKSNKMLFIPSVGPGYIDTDIRPWNGVNTRRRLNGKYYEESFLQAEAVSPAMISITSFNEWHEGTQIEPAVVKQVPNRKYLNYGPKGPNFYLDLTKKWVDKFKHC